MANYIIRLDDACPTMNWEKWVRMEHLLDKYKVKPIVGVIPENQDVDFQYEEKGDFWKWCQLWENKGWIIAQHGTNHVIKACGKQRFYQMTHEYRSEFAGLPYEAQRAKLDYGYQVLLRHGIKTEGFFAPAHTYDANTVKALASFGKRYKFISDGYALGPFKKDNMIFIPSCFDTPHKLTLKHTVMTFVFHPNNMNEEAFASLETFLKSNADNFVSVSEVLMKERIRGGQGFIGKGVEILIWIIRGLREWRNTSAK